VSVDNSQAADGPPLAGRPGSATTNPVESPKWSTKEIPCPDCYGGHFRPCNICGDSGVALLRVESPNAQVEARRK
jgi:hypothetical protein